MDSASISLSNLEQVLSNLKQKQIEILKKSDSLFEETCRIVYQRIKVRTPVGDPTLWKNPPSHVYVPGALRQSWQLSFNGQMVNSTKAAKIYNNRPYTYRIEYGWSHQAPAGMVRVTLKEASQVLKILSLTYNIVS